MRISKSVARRVCALAVGAVGVVGASQASAEQIYGLTGSAAGAGLIRFDSAAPDAAVVIGALSGIEPGEAIRGIDFRPSNGQLYAFGTVSNAYSVYTVDLNTAALTRVGGGTVTNNFPTRVSIDFNPVPDAIRVIDGSGNNYRVNPNTGALINIDGSVAYAAGDPNASTNPPFPMGVAYSNNVAGATTTTMYVADFDLDVLSSSSNPNAGVLNTVGPLIAAGFLTDDAGLGFDISGVTGVAYVSYRSAAVERFGTINLGTGLVTPIGTFGQLDVLDISAVVPEPSSLALLSLAGLGMLRRKR